MRKIAPFFVFLLLLLIARPSFGQVVYRVKRGDTLARIAKRYKTSVKRIEHENGLSSGRLKPGRRLRIAAGRRHRIKRKLRLARGRLARRRIAENKRRAARESEKAAAGAAPDTATQEAAVAKAPAGPAAAAPRADATVDIPKADALNTETPNADSGKAGPAHKDGLEEETVSVAGVPVEPGAKPPIPGLAVQRPGLENENSNSISGAIINSMIRESAREDKIVRKADFAWGHEKEERHRVKRGETLFSIARHYGTTVRRLRKLNHFGARRTRLKPGQRLIVRVTAETKEFSVPHTYLVRRGDTFYRIARKFHLKAEELMDINEMDPSELKPGVEIQLVEDEGPAAASEADPRISAPQIEAKLKEIEDSKALQSLSIKDRLLLFAKTMMNIPYRFGGTSFYGIDCSAFVQKVFTLLDIQLPRTAREQYKEGVPVSLEDLSIGDLVFFRTYASFPSHVGIYIGQNLFVHASSGGHRVKIGNLKTPYFMNRIIGAKRLFFGQELPSAGDGQ
ncbi:MAG: LysM peptidoglycan-binding domain-containing protein [Nitrospiraceae bacterium]|nr:LysM peptidoglycan-binding domain-containing protein [Nitrospiraceae bacterium]